MPQMLSDYKEIDTRPRWQRIAAAATSVFVILLVPTTVLGYFSESSIPGQPLYPLKRGIESMVLLIESLTPYQKTLYYQALATKRVTEAQTVIADSLSSGDLTGNLSNSDQALSNIIISVKQAQQAINTLQDPTQKQVAQQQLATAVQKYQTQLTSMNYTVEQHVISTQTTQPSETPTPGTTTTTATTSSQTTQQAASNLQDQISQTQTDLQTIANQLQTPDQQQNYQLTPTPSPTSTYRQQQDRRDSQTQQQNKDR